MAFPATGTSMAGTQTGQSGDKPLFPRGNFWPFFLVTALFFLWGIPNNLNDELIKQFMKSFSMNRLHAALIEFAFYMGYFFLALPAGFLMRRFGYKAGFVTGLVLFGSGCFLFYPAALAYRYSFFLFALFVIASGLSFLETASNPFIAQCGDPETSELRLNFSQAFNPLGLIAGGLIGTYFIFSGIERTPAQIAAMKAAGAYQAYLHWETRRAGPPYIILGIVVLAWAALIALTKFPRVQGEAAAADVSASRGKLSDLFHHSHFLRGVLAQFFYVGAQAGTWGFFILYVEYYTHEPEKTAGYIFTASLVAFAAGRWLATGLMKFFAASRLMGVYAALNVALCVLGVAFPGWIGVGALFATNLFMSLMYPTIFALGLKGLGPSTKLGGSLMVMAIAGGALFPVLMGVIHSMALAFGLPLLAYVFIAYYGFSGYRPRYASA